MDKLDKTKVSVLDDNKDDDFNIQGINESDSTKEMKFTIEQKEIFIERLGYSKLEGNQDNIVYMITKAENLTFEIALDFLKSFLDEYVDDFNIPETTLELIQILVNSSSLNEKSGPETATSSTETSLESNDKNIAFNLEFQVRVEAAIIMYHSPYPEVRAVTDPFDDPSIPCETLRVYVLGFFWVVVGGVINGYLSNRQPSISIGTTVAQLFIYPCGYIWSVLSPKWSFKIFDILIEINPGPWSYKEQTLATIIYSVSEGTANIKSNIYAQRVSVFYNNQWANWGYQILFAVSVNFLGFGFAGILRKFVVYPCKAVWPGILPTLALQRALVQPNAHEKINGWTISKFIFFFVILSGSFVYFWVPGFLFKSISIFNWMTWIAPNNFPLAAITGSLFGMGINPMPTFDWNIIGVISPMVTPFYTNLNMYVGVVLGTLTIIGIYWKNLYWTSYLPMNSNSIFNNLGQPYDVQRILGSNKLFSQEKYERYGPPFYSAGLLVLYGAHFAIYPFSFVYEIAIRWKDIVNSFKQLYLSIRHPSRSTFNGFNDPQTNMMSRYNEVPDWYFLVVLILSVVLAIVCFVIYPTGTPVWSIFFAIGISLIFLIPITILASTTTFSFGLNVIVEIILGYIIPGNPQAMLLVKAYGTNINSQASSYISDLKLAHYAKIPPRAIFRAQIASALISTFIGLVMINVQLSSISDLCETHQKDRFTCPGPRAIFVSSVTWGVIGPQKVFNGLYPNLKWTFLIGFLLVFPALLTKWYLPKSYSRHFQPTVVMGGFTKFAPYNLSYYTAGMYVSWLFMSYVKKRYTSWWIKYNYILSCGLDAGVALSAIVIFGAVYKDNLKLSWWGNKVYLQGIDGGNGQRSLLKSDAAPEGYFGPRIGSFP
ncbi:oligopeptide transporter 2 [[Candida] anglica]|uniref:Oligopeptide transporter 2 n=1 Tax=[Candida] anglica TaxID=148631 RepID=A0ABP0E7Y0_9ASCO